MKTSCLYYCFWYLISAIISAIVVIGTFSLLTYLFPRVDKISTSVPEHITTAQFEVIDIKSGDIREATAFNSVPEQTDATPCIAADGSNICERFAAGECLIAGNFARLGSKHYVNGFGECTLIDRMNKRYPNRIDIFFGYDVKAAREFGVQKLIVKSL